MATDVFQFTQANALPLSQWGTVPANTEGVYFWGAASGAPQQLQVFYLGTSYDVQNRLKTWYTDLNQQQPTGKAAKIVSWLKEYGLTPANLSFVYTEAAYALAVEAFLLNKYQFPLNTDGQGRSHFINLNNVNWVNKQWQAVSATLAGTGDGLDDAADEMEKAINNDPP